MPHDILKVLINKNISKTHIHTNKMPHDMLKALISTRIIVRLTFTQIKCPMTY